jgi:hypothetical protein
MDITPDPELIPDIQGFIEKYVALPSDDYSLVLSVYALHTWLFKASNVTPYLYVYSDQPQSGKTRLLEVLSVLCRNAKRADDMTAPVMFKLIERECPTLLKDEVDAVWSGSRNETQRQIYNTGYKQGGTAWREQARELVEFSTYCPKVLAGLNNGFMPTTVRDRCIPIELVRRKDGQRIERFVESRVRGTQELETLLDRILAFCELFYADITAMRPEPMTELNDRQDEISEPLLAIAAVFGPYFEQEVRGALRRLFAAGNKTQPDPTQVIFGRIHKAFAGDQKIWTDELCAYLGPMYTGRSLALWLEPYGIAPKNVRKGNDVQKGYTSDQFETVFGKYLGLKDDDPKELEEIA